MNTSSLTLRSKQSKSLRYTKIRNSRRTPKICELSAMLCLESSLSTRSDFGDLVGHLALLSTRNPLQCFQPICCSLHTLLLQIYQYMYTPWYTCVCLPVSVSTHASVLCVHVCCDVGLYESLCLLLCSCISVSSSQTRFGFIDGRIHAYKQDAQRRCRLGLRKQKPSNITSTTLHGTLNP